MLNLPDETGQIMLAQAGHKLAQLQNRRLPSELSICHFVAEMKHPLWVDNAHSHPLLTHHKAVTDLGVAAYLGVPVIPPDRPDICAVLCLLDIHQRTWRAKDLALMKNAAARILDIAPERLVG